MHFSTEDVSDLFLARVPTVCLRRCLNKHSNTTLMPFQHDRDTEDRNCRDRNIRERGKYEGREGDV